MNDAQSLLAEGLAAFRARAYADALSAWRKLLEIEPDHQVAELVRHAEMMANDVDDVDLLRHQVDELREELAATRASRNELLMEMARLHQHYDEQEQRVRRSYDAQLWKLREALAESQLATLDNTQKDESQAPPKTATPPSERKTEDASAAEDAQLIAELQHREVRASIQNNLLTEELHRLRSEVDELRAATTSTTREEGEEFAQSTPSDVANKATEPTQKSVDEPSSPLESSDTPTFTNDDFVLDSGDEGATFENLDAPETKAEPFELDEATIPNEPAIKRDDDAESLLDEHPTDADAALLNEAAPKESSATSRRFHTTATPLLDEEDVGNLSETLFETPEPPRLHTGIVPQLPDLDFDPDPTTLAPADLPTHLDWIPVRNEATTSVSPVAAYLMTHVDGVSSFRDLSAVVGLPQDAVLNGFQELMEAGAILAREP